MSTTPPGWYDDGRGALRWWDGERWTDDVHTPDAAPDPFAGFAASVPPAEPQKPSRWWIWLIVAAGVLIVLGVIAAIFILIGLHAIGAAVGGGTDDEKAAVAVVHSYDDAWAQADCDAFTSITTDDLRSQQGFTDCATFEDYATSLLATTTDYEQTVTSVQTGSDGTITVDTTETYQSMYDENGDPTDDEQTYSDDYEYELTPSDGGWLISGIDTVD